MSVVDVTLPETDFPKGDGEMARLVRAFDWSRTPLGPIETWSVPLRTAVAMLLASPVPIVALWGEAGTMIYNDAYSVFAGGRHPRLLGAAVREGWPEVADFNDNVMKVGLAGGTLSYKDTELTLYRNGQPEQVFMNLDYSPVYGEDGTPIGVIAIVVETTRQRRAETELRQNAERLSFLDELARATASLTDADEVLAVTTRKLGHHLGVAIVAYSDMEPDQDHFTIRGDWSMQGSPSIVGSYSLADFGRLAVEKLSAGEPLIVADVDQELAPEEAANYRAIGVAATICIPLVKDGRLTALMAIHDREPHPWSAEELALLREVTERSWAHIARVRSEREARESDAQFRTFAEAMPNHVWTSRPDGLLDWFNEQVYAYSGARSGELDGASWTAIVHADDIEDVGSSWQRALAAGANYQTEFRLRRHDGTYRWHLARAVPLRDAAGQIVRWIGTNTDVDDQKNAEVLLEQRLMERTAALIETGERLQQAQKMEAIGNLTGGIAHDFNNLLMAVLGSLELLRKRMPPDAALLKLVDNAMEGAQRGSSLTRRMLAFARRQDLRTARVDAQSLVDGMQELLQRSLGPMVEVVADFPPDLPPVETDPNQLESALLNLAVNARDAMPDGEGRINISAHAETVSENSVLAPGRYLCLTVSDNGTGMDAETLQRATEPFFTTKGVGKGTGLGLSMIHGFAEQSGGALVLRSTPGVGTTAEIWLPAVAATLAVPAPAVADERPAEPAAPRPLRVLAVDDDALVLMNTAAMLEDLGHAVTEAYSGAEALTALERDAYDLVITDHAMPQMTGAQLAAEIRRLQPELPILLATGYAELPPGTDTGLPRLSKPFMQADLERALARLLKA